MSAEASDKPSETDKVINHIAMQQAFNSLDDSERRLIMLAICRIRHRSRWQKCLDAIRWPYHEWRRIHWRSFAGRLDVSGSVVG